VSHHPTVTVSESPRAVSGPGFPIESDKGQRRPGLEWETGFPGTGHFSPEGWPQLSSTVVVDSNGRLTMSWLKTVRSRPEFLAW
jgi:hypothetical protein